jgi:putative transposase
MYNVQQNEMPEIKEMFPELKDVCAQTLLDVLRRLDWNFRYFFSQYKNGKMTRLPRFKSINRYDSFTVIQNNWHMWDNYLEITKVGIFKIKKSRPIGGMIKTITIKRTHTKKWFVLFACECVDDNKLPKTGKIVGLDVGVNYFVTDSNGKKSDNPRYLQSGLVDLRIRERRLTRSKRQSNRRERDKLQVAKWHEKVANQRADFLHKVANYYIKEFDVIKIEDLNLPFFINNSNISRSIKDCSWGRFFDFLTYKAEEAGREIIKVNPMYTSKRCNVCGTINHDLKWSNRIWVCPVCGAVHDRDINAAKNVLNSEVRAEPTIVNVCEYVERRL